MHLHRVYFSFYNVIAVSSLVGYLENFIIWRNGGEDTRISGDSYKRRFALAIALAVARLGLDVRR